MQNGTELQALHQVFLSTSVTRADLMQSMNLSQASVVRLVADLRDRGYLVEKQSLSQGRGRPTEVFGINPYCGYVCGIEFGHDHLLLTFLSADGALIASHEINDGPSFEPTDDVMDQLIDIIYTKTSQHNIDPQSIRGVGIAVHGVVNTDGDWLTRVNSIEYPYSIRQYVMQKMRCLVHVEDVSRAFAEAEHRFGAGQHIPDMVYLFIGKHGIGSGIFVNHTLLKNSLGVCGEIGHITVEENGTLCQCGNQGCLETVATHEAVVSTLRKRLAEGVVTMLPNDDSLTFGRICQAYQDGDKEAHITLSHLAQVISKALSSTINIVGATLILIGGQLRLAGDDFLYDLTNMLRQQLLPTLAQHITVGYAEMPTNAGAWGVAAQALDLAWEAGSFLEKPD